MFEDGRKVLKELTKLPPETGRTMVCTSTLSQLNRIFRLPNIQEFHGVDAREYEVIEEVLGKMGRISKPRYVK